MTALVKLSRFGWILPVLTVFLLNGAASSQAPAQPRQRTATPTTAAKIGQAPIKAGGPGGAQAPSTSGGSEPFIGPPPPDPPDPPPPGQAPPTAPVVNYRNGLLTVESTNSRLSDILHAIRTRTGIQFDGLQSSSDRVAVKIGPAPADEVLVELLRGSRFDYMIIGFPDNPLLVQKVILTARDATQALPGAQPQQIQKQSNPDEDDEGGDAEGASTERTPPPPRIQPNQQPQPANPSGVKTSEQLYEELKQMQLRQQQQQQQQNQSGQNPSQPPAQTPPNGAPIKPPLRPNIPQ